MKKPQPMMEWTVDGMGDVILFADDDLTEDDVRAALHFDARVLAALGLSPRKGPVPKGSKPKFNTDKVEYRAPDLAYARVGVMVFQERYRVLLPPATINCSQTEIGAKLACIAASGWTRRTVH